MWFHFMFLLAGWFLIWKAFLSKFRLVRELLGQEEPEEVQPLVAGEQNQNVRARKARRD